jgi:hypothetical protein
MVGILGYKITYNGDKAGHRLYQVGYIGDKVVHFYLCLRWRFKWYCINERFVVCSYEASDLRFVPISQNFGGSSLSCILQHSKEETFDNFIDQDPYLSLKETVYVG